jgi:hypothetical protein
MEFCHKILGHEKVEKPALPKTKPNVAWWLGREVMTSGQPRITYGYYLSFKSAQHYRQAPSRGASSNLVVHNPQSPSVSLVFLLKATI